MFEHRILINSKIYYDKNKMFFLIMFISFQNLYLKHLLVLVVHYHASLDPPVEKLEIVLVVAVYNVVHQLDGFLSVALMVLRMLVLASWSYSVAANKSKLT